jgi:hypothetical protein
MSIKFFLFRSLLRPAGSPVSLYLEENPATGYVLQFRAAKHFVKACRRQVCNT